MLPSTAARMAALPGAFSLLCVSFAHDNRSYSSIVFDLRKDPFACWFYVDDTSFSVSLVERAACSFGTLIKPRKQAGRMFY